MPKEVVLGVNPAAGPGAVPDIAVRLDGLAISPRGQSALISIDGKSADWLALGATRDGVTLMEVHPGKVVVDTAVGFKDVVLGVNPAPSVGLGAPPAGTHPQPAGADR